MHGLINNPRLLDPDVLVLVLKCFRSSILALSRIVSKHAREQVT
jgi:hypothetical protein